MYIFNILFIIDENYILRKKYKFLTTIIVFIGFPMHFLICINIYSNMVKYSFYRNYFFYKLFLCFKYLL